MVDADRDLLAHQALARELTADERALAAALEAIFAAAKHDLGEVVLLLQERGVRRPSGNKMPWSVAALEDEIAQINASLDAAYTGRGARQDP